MRTSLVSWSLAALFLSGAGCSSEKKAEDAVITVENATAAKAAMGKRIQFTGKAYNAKLSAIVVSDHLSLYCIELQEWPTDVLEKEVTVVGTLEQTDQFKVRVDKDGGISQGTGGGDWVLRSVTYEVRK